MATFDASEFDGFLEDLERESESLQFDCPACGKPVALQFSGKVECPH